MNIEIFASKTATLLHRKEVQGTLTFTGPTPSNADVRKLLVEQLKVAESLVSVKRITSAQGSSRAKVLAYVYDDEKVKAHLEQEPKQKKEAAPAAPAK